MAADPDLVGSIRRFNRFYIDLFGLNDRAVHNSPYSNVENRILFEISQAGETSASEIRQQVRIDVGYLSRILGRLERQRLIRRVRDKNDGRQRAITLTESGRAVRQMLDLRAAEEVRGLIAALDDADQQELVGHMRAVHDLLGSGPSRDQSATIRPPEAGEFGWMLQLFATCYLKAPGWGAKAEAEAAALIAQSLTSDTEDWAAWIAETPSRKVGAAICRVRDDQADVPFLAVTPSARRTGIGTDLLSGCLRRARETGASSLALWTDADRVSSVMLHQSGFVRTEEVLVPQKQNVAGPRRKWIWTADAD